MDKWVEEYTKAKAANQLPPTGSSPGVSQMTENARRIFAYRRPNLKKSYLDTAKARAAT